MKEKHFFIKVQNENIRGKGKIITCGCEIIEVNWPSATIKCCKTHEVAIKEGMMKVFPHISRRIENPEEWEVVHLAAIGLSPQYGNSTNKE